MNEQLAQLLVDQAPVIVSLVAALFKKHNPDTPVPTSAEVVAAFEALFADSQARDQFLRAALQAEIERG